MINFFGYAFRRIDFLLALIDIFICSMGFFIYVAFGLASTDSTTPEFISPIFLSILTGFILWCLLFSVGINSLPQINKITSFLLRAILVFALAIPIIVPLWYAAYFRHTPTPLLSIPAIFIQIFLICLMRMIILKFLPEKYKKENIILIMNPKDKDQFKKIIFTHKQYHVKRYININYIQKLKNFDLYRFCQQHNISKVIHTDLDPVCAFKGLIDLSYAGIKIIHLDHFMEQLIGKVSLNAYFNNASFLNGQFTISSINAFFKRSFDIFISLLMLFILWPFMVLIALLIKYCDGGPIFYKQMRVGYNHKLFQIYKFRSMAPHAEKSGAQWATQDDVRVTYIGRFLRKTRMDELPQLINILKNQMSFVGPRPERPEMTKILAQQMPHYDERHRLKPGLTGWAQINLGYSDSIDSSYEKLEYDLYYVKHYNILLDFLIVLKTVSVIFWPHKVH